MHFQMASLLLITATRRQTMDSNPPRNVAASIRRVFPSKAGMGNGNAARERRTTHASFPAAPMAHCGRSAVAKGAIVSTGGATVRPSPGAFATTDGRVLDAATESAKIHAKTAAHWRNLAALAFVPTAILARNVNLTSVQTTHAGITERVPCPARPFRARALKTISESCAISTIRQSRANPLPACKDPAPTTERMITLAHVINTGQAKIATRSSLPNLAR